MINNNEIISDDENIAKIFNYFILNVVKNLNLKLLNQDLDFIDDLLLRAIKCYENHPGISLKKNPFQFVLKNYNEIKTASTFCNIQKQANVIPVLKKIP